MRGRVSEDPFAVFFDAFRTMLLVARAGKFQPRLPTQFLAGRFKPDVAHPKPLD